MEPELQTAMAEHAAQVSGGPPPVEPEPPSALAPAPAPAAEKAAPTPATPAEMQMLAVEDSVRMAAKAEDSQLADEAAATVPDAETKTEGEDAIKDVPPLEGQAEEGGHPGKAEEPTKDEVAASLAAFVRERRELSRQRVQLAAKQRAVEAQAQAQEAELAELRRFQAARQKSPLEAVRALLGDEALQGTLPLEMLQHLSTAEAENANLTDEQRVKLTADLAARQVQEQLRLAREAEAQAQAQARAAQHEQDKQLFFSGLQQMFEADIENYPCLAADPVHVDVMDKAIRAHYAATGRRPTPEMVLRHFERLQQAKAERLAAVLAKRNSPSAPVKSPAVAPVPVNAVDQRKPSKRADSRLSVEEHRKQILERLSRM